jgi:LacI family transcriptional regulator
MLRDVAGAAKVPVGTASKVLSDASGVSPKRMQRVRDAARQIGYRRNSIAADLRRSRPTSIAFVLPDLKNRFFVDIARALENHALQHGHSLILAHADEDPQREPKRLRFVLSRQIADVIVIPYSGHQHAIEEARDCNVPLAMADRVDDTFPANTVTTNSRSAWEDGMARLIALGHKRIAFLVNTLNLANSRERADGCVSAIRHAPLNDYISVVECGKTTTQKHTSKRQKIKRLTTWRQFETLNR